MGNGTALLGERREAPRRASTPGLDHLLAALIAASAVGCGRSAEDVKALPPSAASFSIDAPCTPAAANAAVAPSGEAMEMEVDIPAEKPGDPWVLKRGMRLVDPALYYRVLVAPGAGADSVQIRVFAIAKPPGITDTQETLSKPGELAMRIVAACVAGGAR